MTTSTKTKSADKPKLGMYGETPRIQVGDFEICEFTTPPGEFVWIEILGGEGAQFPKERLAPILKQFFHDNF